MYIDVVAPPALSAEDITAWKALQQSQPHFVSPFLSPEWPLLLSRVQGPDRRQGRVAVLRQAGRALGFLPVRVLSFTALPLGTPLSDYQAAIVEPGLEFDPRQIVKALGVSRLDFSHLLDGQPAFQPYARGVARSQIIDISEGYDAYAAARRAAGTDILQDCAKKRRKLEREHGPVTFTALSAERADFDQLIAWKRAQYRQTRQTDIFDAGWPLEVLEALFARQEPEFGGALFTLSAAGKLAAAHFALRAGPVLHAWFIAHDDAFGRYSPGVVLIVDMLRWAAQNGVREIDLGPGDYRFKLSLANAQRTVAHGFVGLPSPASLVRLAQYRVRETAEALPFGRISDLPGKAMRRLDIWRGLR